MASSEQSCLRFFAMSCCFSLTIGIIGCATNNWSRPLFPGGNVRALHAANEDSGNPKEESFRSKFWEPSFGRVSGLDPTAREIERSLGYE